MYMFKLAQIYAERLTFRKHFYNKFFCNNLLLTANSLSVQIVFARKAYILITFCGISVGVGIRVYYYFKLLK
jgi:hypothetical protein